jgi:hypothetical protein
VKRATSLTALILIAFLAGCSSPRAQWAVARSSLTQTENALVTANQSGLLPDRDFVAVQPFAKAVQGALAQADAELVASNDQPTSKFRFYMGLAQKTLAQLQTYKQASPAKKVSFPWKS